MRHTLATLVAALAAIGLLAVPTLVLGHVELTHSSPAAGTNLDAPPGHVSVAFDDELDPQQSSFSVTDANGHQVGGGEVDLTVADRNVMRGPVSITDPGIYTVRYTVAGVDGHVLGGTFSFGYQALQTIPGPTGGEHGPDTATSAPPTSLSLIVGLLCLTAAVVLTAVRRRPA